MGRGNAGLRRCRHCSTAPLLGAYWKGRDTDFEALNAALTAADEVLHVLGGQVPSALSDLPMHTGSRRRLHSRSPKQDASTLTEWRGSLAARTKPVRTPGTAPRFGRGCDRVAAGACRADAPGGRPHRCRRGRDRSQAHVSPKPTPCSGWPIAPARPTRHFTIGRAVLSAARSATTSTSRTLISTALDVALAWAERLRALVGGPLTERTGQGSG